MRSWRQWDLPSLVLESIFLSHLASIADALSMLAFQKTQKNSNLATNNTTDGTTSSHLNHTSSYSQSNGNYSTNGDPIPIGETSRTLSTDGTTSRTTTDGSNHAPIFSSKLYLALTHYRLNQLTRSQSTRLTTSSVSGGSSSSSTGVPSSSSQMNRLWSEVWTNLNRDLELTPATAPVTTNTNVIVFKGLNPPPPIVIPNGAPPRNRSNKDGGARMTNGNNGSGPSNRSIVAFSCGHSYDEREFHSHSLPEFFHAVGLLTPPIPITSKCLAEEYGLLSQLAPDEDELDERQSGSTISQRRRVAALACPYCVFTTLQQLHQRHELSRTNASVHIPSTSSTHWNLQSTNSVTMNGRSIASATARSLASTPSPLSSTPPHSAPSTTLAFIQQSNNSSFQLHPNSSTTDSPRTAAMRHRQSVGLPPVNGNGNKMHFGKVSSADLENA